MKTFLTTICLVLILTVPVLSTFLQAQNPVNRDSILTAAKEIIAGTTYCALATIDSTGKPDIRTMNPFPPSGDWITWFATARNSEKVKEIRRNPWVCVYYADHTAAKGYVNISGKAEIIDDKELLIKKKRDYWDGISGWQENFVLIRVAPVTMEVINYAHKVYNDPKTLKAPKIEF